MKKSIDSPETEKEEKFGTNQKNIRMNQRKLSIWTLINVDHQTGHDNTKVPLDGRNVRNVDWPFSQMLPFEQKSKPRKGRSGKQRGRR